MDGVGDWLLDSKHLILQYFEPVGIDIHEWPEGGILDLIHMGEEGQPSTAPENTLFSITFLTNEFYRIDEEDAVKTEKFEQLAQKFGDINYYDTVLTEPTFHSFNITLTTRITKIEVKALSDYNENYPAGSSLNDIARITYGTVEPFIKNGYKLPNGENHAPYKKERKYMNTRFGWYKTEFTYYARPLSENFVISMPTIESPSAPVEKPLPWHQPFASISFDQAPASKDNLAFEVSVTLDNGKVLKATMGK